MSQRKRSSAAAFAALLTLVSSAAGAAGFVANLSGGQEVPAVDSPSSGACTAVLFSEQIGGGDDSEPTEVSKLAVTCTHDVAGATAAHVHFGEPGANGPVVFPFADPLSIEGVFEPSLEQLAWLVNESLYVNVHSSAHPNGEVRGQLRVQSLLDANYLIPVPLAGDQVVPPITTAATGRCLVQVEPESAEDREIAVVCYHDVAEPTGAAIRFAAAGETGAEVGELFVFGGVVVGGVPATPANLGALGARRLYVQIDSAAHPEGELRGQIFGCAEGPRFLCLNDSRFLVSVSWTDFAGNSGSGTAVRESTDAGLFWFFDPDNAEVLVKVLDACDLPGFNSYWVLMSATTNVEYRVTVIDTLTEETRVYENALGTPAAPVIDTAAFTACP